MKRLTLTCTLLLLGVTAFAQNLQVATYLEQTHVSPKFGTSLGYQFKEHIEVGGFFQRAAEIAEPEAGRPLKSENEFYGAYFAYPLFNDFNTHIKFNVRTGVSNGENFVITPSILAGFQPLKILTIGGGIGTRAFRPTYMASIKINIGGTSKGGSLIALND